MDGSKIRKIVSLRIAIVSLLLLGFALLHPLTTSAKTSIFSELKKIPVQGGGRIKPFDTLAREALHLIHGRETYHGREAVEIVLTWSMIPDHWVKEPFFQIRHKGLREALKLTGDRVYYSPNELLGNSHMSLIFQGMSTKVKNGEKLGPYFQAVQTLKIQLDTFYSLKAGDGIRVEPPETGDVWISISQLTGKSKEIMQKIQTEFIAGIGKSGTEKGALIDLAPGFGAAVKEFVDHQKQLHPDNYADLTKVKMEIHLNNFRPFQKAWIFYLIGALFMLAALVNSRRTYVRLAWAATAAGIFIHIYGMGLRVFLSGRAPVSNMYETVVWVALGVLLLTIILESIYKFKFVLILANLVAMFCLILTDLAPGVLDKAIHPLVPVLKDNFWLLTHVLMITLSYSAFFLAFALGDLLLIYYLVDEKRFEQGIKNGVKAIYRAIQVGVVLLAGGIILGGIWADYSWGRYWGWDPKETWALIALLGYVAVLHARLAGWLKNFGLAACSIISFSLVIMAWYGVNFVLGAGLHTYGFGAGGVEYVAIFVAIHLIFVLFSAVYRRSRISQGKASQ